MVSPVMRCYTPYVWLYHRFNLSARDIEDLMSERGIAISYESIRLWCIKFGPKYAKRLRRRHRGYGDTFFLDEVFVKIQKSPWLISAADLAKHIDQQRQLATDQWASMN